MQLSSNGWTAREEATIAGIMADENLTRIEAIQAMQRRKKAGTSLSRRLKLDDPFQSSARCQNRRCVECALTSGDTDPEMTAFLDLMVNGKRRSVDYFIVQRDPSTGEFPVSGRMDDSCPLPIPESAVSEWTELVPKHPFESAVELTAAGIVESQVYVRRAKSSTPEENTFPPPTEAITGSNVDGLLPVSAGMTVEPMPSQTPIKRYAGRPKLSDQQKRLTASERQARWRERQRGRTAICPD